MKIYTKRGDAGMTDLFGGDRVKKCHRRVKSYGDIDCANTAIGVAYACPELDDYCREQLLHVMKLMFCLGAEVATAPKEMAHHLLERHLKNRISDAHIAFLEHAIDHMQCTMTPLRSFILPTGTDAAARLHFARNMVRKAEITLIELKEAQEEVRADVLKFINRLSDFLFVMARFANSINNREEIAWNGLIADE